MEIETNDTPTDEFTVADGTVMDNMVSGVVRIVATLSIGFIAQLAVNAVTEAVDSKIVERRLGKIEEQTLLEAPETE